MNYGLDLDKVESHFVKLVKMGDPRKIAQFSIEIVPKLLKELGETRVELMDAILLEHPLQKIKRIESPWVSEPCVLVPVKNKEGGTL